MTSIEGVTQVYHLLMVLYGMSHLPLAESMREADSGVIHPWYADNAAKRGTARRKAKLLRDLMEKSLIMGTFWSRIRASTFVRRGEKRRKKNQLLKMKD